MVCTYLSPNPNILDRHLYNLGADFTKLLQVPTVDSPVVALSAPPVLTGPPEEILRPEDKRAEQLLVKAHQLAAWAIRVSSAASFFNRASLLWLKELQDRFPPTDTRLQQVLNKIVTALEFSADITLNASTFAAKSIGSTISSIRLLWRHHWHAEAKNKWRLASAPYSGGTLFHPFWWNPGISTKSYQTYPADQIPGRPPIFIPFRAQTPASCHRDHNSPFPLGRVDVRTDRVARDRAAPSSGPFEAGGVAPFNTPADCTSNPPIGGRLALFASQWEVTTKDAWVREMVRSGLSTPPSLFVHCLLSRDWMKRLLWNWP